MHTVAVISGPRSIATKDTDTDIFRPLSAVTSAPMDLEVLLTQPSGDTVSFNTGPDMLLHGDTLASLRARLAFTKLRNG